MKKSLYKQYLAAIITAALVTGSMSGPVFGAQAGGSGSMSDPGESAIAAAADANEDASANAASLQEEEAEGYAADEDNPDAAEADVENEGEEATEGADTTDPSGEADAGAIEEPDAEPAGETDAGAAEKADAGAAEKADAGAAEDADTESARETDTEYAETVDNEDAGAEAEHTGQGALEENQASDSEQKVAEDGAVSAEEPVEAAPEEEFVVIDVQAAASGDFTIIDGVLTEYNGDGGDVVIPEGVTSIGAGAFWDCSRLTSVTIPESVTSIGEYAFWGCSRLTSVMIPSSVTSIGGDAFKGCSSLEEIMVAEENGAYSSKDGVLFNKDQTAILCFPAGKGGSYSIPGSVNSIGDFAFEYCRSLTSVVIPGSVTSIGHCAFYDCSSLASVTISEGVTSIGDWAFYDCSSLTSVTIPGSVTNIGDYAFNECSGLTSVTIPGSVTSIGNGAFCGCSILASVMIPEGVTSIGEFAFSGCSSLTSVTIPESVTSIGYSAFSDCSSLADVYYSGSEGSWNQISIDEGNDSLLNATIHFINEAVEVTIIELNKTSVELACAETLQLAVTVTPDNATDKTIIWSSDNTSIATVDADGVVTGMGTGTATITATASDGSGVTATCKVIVTPKSLSMMGVIPESYNKLNVSWEKCEGAEGYMVYRKGNGEAYALVKSLSGEDSTSFTNSVVSGAKYTYKVSAYKMDGKKKIILAQTGELSGTALPAAPAMKSTGMAAFNKIKVIWTKVSGCAGYVICRSTEENGEYSVLKTVTMATATEYSDIIQDGQTYYYKIRAFVEVNGKKVYGDYSEVLSGDVIDAPPANFRLEQRTATKIIFNWDKVEDSEGYVIYRYFPDTNKCKAIKNIASNDTLTYSYKVDADTDYQFTIRAFRVVNGKKVYSDYTEIVSK